MHPITIVGLGSGELEQLSVGVYRKLKAAKNLIVRTEHHPAIDELKAESVSMLSFDSVYESHDAFEEVYEEIVKRLLQMAKENPVTYAVPGHPLVAERTVQLLIERERVNEAVLEIAGGNSFLDPIFAALRIDPIEGFQLLDGTEFNQDDVQMRQHVLIGQVYDSFVASDVKLTLLEKYDVNHPVTIVTAAGTSAEKLRTVPLVDLDRETSIDNLTTIYIPPVMEQAARLKEWQTFRAIIAKLRSPEGCPWDREQTHVSLKRYLIEEAHEVLDAIDREDDDNLVEELGDVLLQVFLHAQIGEDEGYFTMEDILQTVGDKMIRRHPHVFGELEVADSDEVLKNWQDIKSEEKPKNSSLLDGQALTNSSLLTSFNYQKAAARVGFDWADAAGAFDKFEEEWQEFKDEVENGTQDSRTDELGDVFFTLVNIARFLKLSPEEAMQHANQKFSNRFSYIEKSVAAGRGDFEAYTIDELEEFWQQAKKIGGNGNETR
ncbi:bifunctional methyltransferase/pyrophosphohydrolase YabN [Sporosarcina aquimarina]|uniref:Nucleoside triphosphate pyrophosphohydrolase n=1 Tax=Sporosarcina aquimarina TaxID=114975 RepID=A0ABU4G2Z6_9BACL|nr:nucleoside triphosphate pyrophosphohydrolase [Sporosarcina aquimarina]MDW0111349.1 nucleoside triphosphate pyrophosphohydrolase [Sporosarcina aquimarina]